MIWIEILLCKTHHHNIVCIWSDLFVSFCVCQFPQLPRQRRCEKKRKIKRALLPILTGWLSFLENKHCCYITEQRPHIHWLRPSSNNDLNCVEIFVTELSFLLMKGNGQRNGPASLTVTFQVRTGLFVRLRVGVERTACLIKADSAKLLEGRVTSYIMLAFLCTEVKCGIFCPTHTHIYLSLFDIMCSFSLNQPNLHNLSNPNTCLTYI